MSALRDALRDLSDDVFFDLLESEDAYLLVLDVPGVTLDTLEVSVEGGRLSVDARREKDQPGDYQYVEENRPMFVDVSLPLPDDVSAETPSAEVDRGVLEIRIPKRTTETTIDVTTPGRTRSSDGDADSDGTDGTDGSDDGTTAGGGTGEPDDPAGTDATSDGDEFDDEPR